MTPRTLKIIGSILAAVLAALHAIPGLPPEILPLADAISGVLVGWLHIPQPTVMA